MESKLNILAIVAAFMSCHAFASDLPNPNSSAAVAEQYAREVDEAALASQDQAAIDLKALLAKYRGTDKEPLFLYQLADIYQQSAAMRFRVAHELAHRTGKAVDLTAYHKAMSDSIPPLGELIARFPSFNDRAHVIYMRGKAYEEIGNIAAASRDYLSLTGTYPSAPDAIPAYMSLADFAIDAGKHAQAIIYLRNVERNPQDPHYPFALYKTAWSFYNLRNVTASLAYVDKMTAYYGGRELAPTEQQMLENIQMDAALFYFDGCEQRRPEYDASHALAYFHKLAGESPVLGKMALRYAKLLRTHDHEPELTRFKNEMVASETARPETFEIVLATYELQLHKGDYSGLTASSRDIVRLIGRNKDGSERAEKMLFDTTQALEGMMIKEKGTDLIPTIGAELATVYRSFADIVGEDDPRIRSVRANLAETLFAIKDYDKASDEYRWVVRHGSWSESAKTPKSVTGGMTVAEASLKSIGARYESLSARNLIPGKLEAVAMPRKDPGNVNPMISEWVDWVDTHVRKTHDPIENFQFEANRCLYGQGQINLATARMRAFALRYPKSSFAIPAATLVVDTTIASGRWVELEQLAEQFRGVEEWKASPFAKRLYTVAADAKYKRTEQMVSTKEYKDALEQADQFSEHYSASPHLIDVLALAGNAAVEMHNRQLAIRYYTRLAASAPGTETAAKSLLAMAKIEEDRYAFASAAGKYLAYLSLPPSATRLTAKREIELKRRVLTLSWLGGDSAQLSHFLRSRYLCGSSATWSECDRYSALRHLMPEAAPVAPAMAARNALHASEQTRAIWAAIALEHANRLDFNSRHQMVRQLATYWERLDSLAKFSLINRISASVPEAFRLDRGIVAHAGRLRAERRSLERRLGLIQEMESTATVAAKLPWSRIRVLVLNEVAWAYDDLAKGIESIPAPRKLSREDRETYRKMTARLESPFVEKARDIRRTAFELASRVSVDPDAYNAVAQAFFGSSGRAGVVPVQRNTGSELTLDLVRSVDEQGNWKPVDYDTAEQSKVLRARWAAALDRHQWQQVGFFIQESRKKSLLPPEVIGVANAVSLAAAGARAEGGMALSDLCHSVEGRHAKPACSDQRQLAALDGGQS